MEDNININKNTKKFSKSDLIFYFSRQDFPINLLSKELRNEKKKEQEILFSNEIQEPESQIIKKKIKIGNSFLIEEELENRKGGYKGKKPYITNNNTLNQNRQNFNNNQNLNDGWRRNEPEEPGFFDDFKGKSDAKQVFAFKRNLELYEIKEMNLMINNSKLFDFKEKEEMEEKEFFEGKKRKKGK